MNEKDKYIGQLLGDRYEIQEVIGEGGMAVVYRALCHRLDRGVAVKIMRDDTAADEEFRSRFCAESHAVAMLSHPNIVAVYDVSHNDDIEYIVMELVDGITLKQYMNRRGAINWREALYFSRQIARALSHAHERGIIHRDIKPQNIMLLKDGTIKVGDFGIAALENEIHENNGEAIGSIHYIAPEQARGECPDARGDIYSLGVVMYEMLTGELPYTGDTIGEVAIKHMGIDPVPIREKVDNVPAEFEAIVAKAMATELDARYQSVNAILEDMESLIQNVSEAEAAEEEANPDVVPIRSSSELPKEKYRRRRRRARRVSYMSGTFLVMLMLIGLVAFIWNFWLGDVFAPAERIDMPNFVGSNFDAVVDNPELAGVYTFKVVYITDADSEPGRILSQFPEEGRSVMLSPNGIEVELTVNAGLVLTPVPDVVNIDYREAMLQLQRTGFEVEIENSTSDSVTKNYVISTSPAANEQISNGSIVYLVVSSGPEISYIEMPNLVGYSESDAISKLELSNLSFGGSERVESSLEAGTVIGQSIEAFSTVEEHSKVYLTISSGPAA